MDKTESPGAGNLVDVIALREVDFDQPGGFAESRVLKVDRQRNLVTVMRIEPDPFVAVAGFDRFQNANKALRRDLIDDAGGLQQVDERGSGTVHDRHFRRIDLDDHIVEAEPGESRHQMLDRADTHAVLDER